MLLNTKLLKHQLQQINTGGGTKALATFGFGLLGYAASSGVKTEVKTEKIKTQDAKYCYTTINISKNMWILILPYPEKITLNLF